MDADDQAAWQTIEEIFFASSPRQQFPDETARHAFYHRWTDHYRYRETGQVLLYRLADRTIAGYLTGCLNSLGASSLYQGLETYSLFEAYFEQFPGHFHINCHRAHRNRGIGAVLVSAFLDNCRDRSLSGVHVVTAVGARSVAFYRRIGFEPLHECEFEGINRLLLGLRLGCS